MPGKDIEFTIGARNETEVVMDEVVADAEKMMREIERRVERTVGAANSNFIEKFDRTFTELQSKITVVTDVAEIGFQAIDITSNAIKGNWDAVAETVKEIPFGLGQVASAAEKALGSITGWNDEIAEAEAGIAKIEERIGRLQREVQEGEAFQERVTGIDYELELAKLEEFERRRVEIRTEFAERIRSLEEEQAGLLDVSGAQAERLEEAKRQLRELEEIRLAEIDRAEAEAAEREAERQKTIEERRLAEIERAAEKEIRLRESTAEKIERLRAKAEDRAIQEQISASSESETLLRDRIREIDREISARSRSDSLSFSDFRLLSAPTDSGGLDSPEVRELKQQRRTLEEQAKEVETQTDILRDLLEEIRDQREESVEI